MNIPEGRLLMSSSDGILEILTKFLNYNLVNCSHNEIEIEAKFGTFIDKSTNERVRLPVLTETVLEPGSWYRFSSELTKTQHMFFNGFLNEQVRNPECPWKYLHSKTIDIKLQDDTRVTKEAATGKVKEVLQKVRLADMAIYAPNRPFDIRVSINREVPIHDFNTNGVFSSENERFKDRMSYIDPKQDIRYDLTLVKQKCRGVEQNRYELEIEHLKPDLALKDPASFLKAILAVPSLAGKQ